MRIVNVPPCKVEKFKRGGDTTIQNWFFQMEYYFLSFEIPPERRVSCCMTMFYGAHFEEVEPYRNLDYAAFKAAVIELYQKPVLTQYKQQQLIDIHQGERETPEQFMVRVRNLTQEAYPNLPDAERQEMSINFFTHGLQDKEVAKLVAIQGRGSVAIAVRIAAEATAYSGKVVPSEPRKDRRQRRERNLAVLPAETEQEQDNDYNNEYYNYNQEGEGDDSYYTEQYEEEEYTEEGAEDDTCMYGATAGAPSTNTEFRGRTQFRGRARGRGFRGRGGYPPRGRGNGNGVRPASTSSGPMQCYNCRGFGHRSAVCPSPRNDNTNSRPSYNSGPIQPAVVQQARPNISTTPSTSTASGNSSVAATAATRRTPTDRARELLSLASQLTLDEQQPEFLGMLPTRTTGATSSVHISIPSKLPKTSPIPEHYSSGWLLEPTQPSTPSATSSTSATSSSSTTIPSVACTDNSHVRIAPEIFTSDDIVKDVACTTPESNAKRLLFWVTATVQDREILTLADTGSCRNLMSKAFWMSLPAQDTLAPPGSTVVVAGDGKTLNLLGWSLVKFEIAGRPLYHEVGVVEDLPIDFLLGGEFMSPHTCNLQYSPTSRNTFTLGAGACAVCKRNHSLMHTGQSPMLRHFHKSQASAGKVSATTPVGSEAVLATVDDAAATRRKKLEKVLGELKINDLTVSAKLKHSLVALVDRCLDAFAADDDDIGYTTLVEHAINTGDAPPFREKLRPLPISRRDFCEKEVDRYLRLDVIEPTTAGKCPYASAVVIVGKKEVDLALLALALRMCIDYRRLNHDTDKDSWPLPRIDDIINYLHGAKYFASLDLLMGYHQIPIKESDRPKTAFITHRGLFQFKRMPFGLCNAPATFQRLMDELFSTEIGKILLVYLDDLLIFAKTEEELLIGLEKTLKKLIAAGLKCKPRKCKLFRDSIEYLGHVISEMGVAPDRSKIEKIEKWPFPTTGVELASFLGLANYYRRLIDKFADWSFPLYKLVKEPILVATPELLKAFEDIKHAACQIPTVRIPDVTKPFIVETDASNVAVGAVLKQAGNDGKEFPVMFYSQGLSKSERNYSTYERELYAVVKACEAFRVFLLSNPFTLRTDHKALAALFNSKLKDSTRIVKWVMRLQEYPFHVEYLAGKDNTVADALSRIPWPTSMLPEIEYEQEGDPSPELDDEVSATCLDFTSVELAAPDLVQSAPALTLEEISEEQLKDPELTQVRTWVETRRAPTEAEILGQSAALREYAQRFPTLEIRNGVLGCTDSDSHVSFRICVPYTLVDRVLEKVHDNMAHEGAKKVVLRLVRSFYWPTLARDTKLFVSTCPVCDRFKIQARSPRSPLHPVRVGARGEILALDFVGGRDALPTTPRGNKLILVMIDLFTRYVVAIPLPNQTASTLVETLVNNYLLVYGAPRRILTDRGANFESALFANVCTMWRIHKSRTTAYHPATNGACERVNGTIKRGLQKVLNEKNLSDWDLVLPHVLFAYNTSVHSSTTFTPFFLMFGTEARIPADIVVGRPPLESTPASYALSYVRTLEKSFYEVREALGASQKVMKDRYDLGATSRVFRPGDQVRIRLKNLSFKPASKLRSPWSNLLEVLSVNGVVVTLRDPADNRQLTVHADRLTNVSPKLRYEPRVARANAATAAADLVNPQPSALDTDSEHEHEHEHTTDSESDSTSHVDSTHDSVVNSSRAPGKRQVKSTRRSDFVYCFYSSTQGASVAMSAEQQFKEPAAPGGEPPGKRAKTEVPREIAKLAPRERIV